MNIVLPCCRTSVTSARWLRPRRAVRPTVAPVYAARPGRGSQMRSRITAGLVAVLGAGLGFLGGIYGVMTVGGLLSAQFDPGFGYGTIFFGLIGMAVGAVLGGRIGVGLGAVG